VIALPSQISPTPISPAQRSKADFGQNLISMASASLSSGRKRTTSASHEASRTPSKRRRLQLEAASSPSTPKALNAIQAAISNVFRLGGRQDGTKGIESPTTLEDEIANSDEDSRPRPTPRSAGKMNGSARKVAFQIDESGDELSTYVAPTPSALERRRRASGQQPAKSPLAVRRIPNGLAPTASSIEVVFDSAKPKKVTAPSSATRKLKMAVEPGLQSGRNGKRLQNSLPKKSAGHAGNQTGSLSKHDLFDGLPTDTTQNADTQGAGSTEKVVPAAAETDEEVCQICSRPESAMGNEILLCDGCDRAFHQKCYGILSIPAGDWFCKDCEQGTIAADILTEEGVLDDDVVTVLDELPVIANFEQHLRKMQSVLLARCTGRRRINLRGQDEAYDKVYQLVEQTVLAGEGNSMLIIGARGSGKTTLVEGVISDLAAGNGDAFHTVRLNGFVHTDDKLALREIWRQLGKEMDVEDELVQKTNSYADTLQSLLAVLSHPSEISGSSEGVTSRSVVFVIDEFDLFATHARQTLLYNLFDIAQARKAPIAVLGLTTRIDVVESLEKRVKSRFSHRYVHLALVKSLPAYWDICRQGLALDQADMATEGLDVTVKGHHDFWKWWEAKVEVRLNVGQARVASSLTLATRCFMRTGRSKTTWSTTTTQQSRSLRSWFPAFCH
jgi:origin recognition complex subunit 4